MGNRLIEDSLAGPVSYVYDDANRPTSVGGVTYAWDDNGNLLSDGVSTYAYDHANRLIAVSGQPSAFSFGYNGLGDRLRQTIDGVPTNYTVDLAAGLTQVLADGPNAYLYGLTRIGEKQTGGWQYHLGDALGSVRQLTSPSGAVTLARSYEPFGDTLTTSGSAATVWQYTGEARDATGLTYLRARYLSSSVGRFLTRDVWEGDPNQPMSYNAWLYVYANPATRPDPSGHGTQHPCSGISIEDEQECELLEFIRSEMEPQRERPSSRRTLLAEPPPAPRSVAGHVPPLNFG